MENHISPLISASATPPHIYSQLSSESDHIDNELTSAFTPATPVQNAAINDLRDFSEETVIAWLAFVRSLEPNFRYQNAAGGLSHQQVNAVSTLKDCSDSNIIIWLQCAILSGTVKSRQGVSRTASKSSTSSTRQRRSSARSTIKSSASSLIPSIYSTNTNYSTPRSSTGYASSLPDLPEGLSENESLNHTHWCPECGKQVNSCDGWKRHMKEHETFYPCMPSGPVEDTIDGRKCAFCGVLSPSREHLAEHHITLCHSNSKSPARKSRKSLMVNHLAQHNVFDEAASDLAEKWKCDRKRRAFACGFCVKSFTTIMDQLNHIDNEHYKYGQDKSSWDISTVMKGLLHQPKVRKFWERVLASKQLDEIHFRWDSPAAENLLLELETGHKSGADLALNAFETGICGDSFSSQQISNTVTIPVLQHMSSDPALITSQPQNFMREAASLDSVYDSDSLTKQRNAGLVSRYQSSVPSRGDLSSPYSDFDPMTSFPQICPEYPGDPFQNGSGPSTGPGTSFDGDADLISPWTSSNEMAIATAPSHQDSLFDQHANLQGQLDENGNLVFAQLSYPNLGASASFAHYHDTAYHSNTQGATFAPVSIESTTSLPSTDNASTIRNTSPKSWEKPLPALPASEEGPIQTANGARPKSPMDIDVG